MSLWLEDGSSTPRVIDIKYITLLKLIWKISAINIFCNISFSLDIGEQQTVRIVFP